NPTQEKTPAQFLCSPDGRGRERPSRESFGSPDGPRTPIRKNCRDRSLSGSERSRLPFLSESANGEDEYPVRTGRIFLRLFHLWDLLLLQCGHRTGRRGGSGSGPRARTLGGDRENEKASLHLSTGVSLLRSRKVVSGSWHRSKGKRASFKR